MFIRISKKGLRGLNRPPLVGERSTRVYQSTFQTQGVLFLSELLIRFLAFRSCLVSLRDPAFLFDLILVSMMMLESWVMPLIDLISGVRVCRAICTGVCGQMLTGARTKIRLISQ